MAVAIHTRMFGKVSSGKTLDPQMLHEIEQFFVTYNQEEGKEFKLLGLHGPNRAEKLAKAGIKLFKKSSDNRRGQKKK